MRVKSLTLVALSVLVGMAGWSSAAVILGETDWLEWTAASALPPNPVQTGLGDSQFPQAQTGVNDVWSSGTDGLEFSGDDTAGGVYDDLIYETAGDLTGDNTVGSAFAVQMDFYIDSAAYAPDELSFYFVTGDGYTWYYDLVPGSGAGSQTYTAFLFDDTGWYSDDGGTDFLTSISDVNGLTAAGINLLYDQDIGENQQYGILGYDFVDNDGFAVPEPGTYMVLSVAFMSLGFSFRRREREKKDVA